MRSFVKALSSALQANNSKPGESNDRNNVAVRESGAEDPPRSLKPSGTRRRWPWLGPALTALSGKFAMLEQDVQRLRQQQCKGPGSLSRRIMMYKRESRLRLSQQGATSSASAHTNTRGQRKTKRKVQSSRASPCRPAWQGANPNSPPQSPTTFLKAGSRNPKSQLPPPAPRTHQDGNGQSPIAQLAAFRRSRRPSWHHGNNQGDSWSFTVVRERVLNQVMASHTTISEM